MLKDVTIGRDGHINPPILQAPGHAGHKHTRGHVAVMSGPALSTGASRLSAMAALGMGAGLVTIYGKENALREHAAHVTAIMLGSEKQLLSGATRSIDAAVIGPGHGGGEHTRRSARYVLDAGYPSVLDADALTAFEDVPDELFAHVHECTVLTPHTGEFARLFGPVGNDPLAACKQAASRSGAVTLLKGATTTIAAPDGRWALNDHASAWLATAGSGDVLAGMIAALLGQGHDPFASACAAVWLHGDIGVKHGPGLTADRMIGHMPEIIAARLND